MSVKYICPNCSAIMQQNREDEMTDGNRVIEPRHKIFQCINPSCRYTCAESVLRQISGNEGTVK